MCHVTRVTVMHFITGIIAINNVIVNLMMMVMVVVMMMMMMMMMTMTMMMMLMMMMTTNIITIITCSKPHKCAPQAPATKGV